jgi:hypothetical protein
MLWPTHFFQALYKVCHTHSFVSKRFISHKMRSSKGALSKSALAMAPTFHQEGTCSFPGPVMEAVAVGQAALCRSSKQSILIRPARYTS